MEKCNFENVCEHIISFNEIDYHIIIKLEELIQKIILLVKVDKFPSSLYELQIDFEELKYFCKVFKSCDSINDAFKMLNNYFKSKKGGIKELSPNYIKLYINAEVLGEDRTLELILNKNKNDNIDSKKEISEVLELELNQKNFSSKLEFALNNINRLTKELQEIKLLNSSLSNQLKEIENENGDKYIGSMYNNKKEGRGKMMYKNGEKYIGEWSNDLKDGKGIYYYNNGNKYDGFFNEGKRNGKGIMFYKNGDKYDGEWKNDVFDGFGILYYKNGRRYIGEFQNDKIHGKGVMYYNNGDKYEGDWRRDNREGKGVMFYFDGERYEGEWVKNKREGFGRHYFKNGDIEEGMYKESKKVGTHKKYIANYEIKEFIY